MKKKIKEFLTLICVMFSFVFFYSCKTTDRSLKSENKSESTERLISLTLLSLFDLEVSNAKTTITLFGYDKLMADAEATLICEKEIYISKLPCTVELELPTEPEALIYPKISSKENVNYYLSVYGDLNTNGKQDKGDIKINFDQGFPNIDINSKDPQIIYIKNI